jgi:acyl-homoserine lactone acylase PvdQ
MRECSRSHQIERLHRRDSADIRILSADRYVADRGHDHWDDLSGWSQLNVMGDEVRIYRDEYGVPHIFAETSRGL